MEQNVFFSRRLDNRSVKIAGSAILGAMAFLLQLFVKFPFPLLPWLVFDFAEIPTVVSLILFGPVWGILSSAMLWLILVMRGGSFPPGPYMKFAAVVSMQVGIWLGFVIARRMGINRSGVHLLASGLIVGLFLRVLIMTPINYLVVGVLFASDFYFKTAAKALGLVGISLVSQWQFITLMLVLTAIYNVLHVLLSVVPTLAITKFTPIMSGSWLTDNIKPRAQRPRHISSGA